MLGVFARVPKKRIQRLAAESGANRFSIVHIFEKHKWHPYKMQLLQQLGEGNLDRRNFVQR
jgi:hypothetical protein